MLITGFTQRMHAFTEGYETPASQWSRNSRPDLLDDLDVSIRYSGTIMKGMMIL